MQRNIKCLHMIFISFIKNGLLLGIRHFEPDEIRNYWEIHILLLVFQVNIFITIKDDNK